MSAFSTSQKAMVSSYSVHAVGSSEDCGKTIVLDRQFQSVDANCNGISNGARTITISSFRPHKSFRQVKDGQY